MLDPHLYPLLAQLHDNLAVTAAARLRATVAPLAAHACLVRLQPPGRGAAHSLQVTEVLPTFVARLQTQGKQALAAYLAQALQPDSAVRSHLADMGWAPDFTALVQTVLLPVQPGQPAHSAPPEALMVLLCSASLTLPVFHRITTDPQGQRQCTLRSFPSAADIQALQPLVQSGMLMHAALQ